MELIILYAVMNGIPIKQMVKYLTVSSSACSGVDMAETMGWSSKSSKTVIIIETAINNVAVLPMLMEVCF